MKRNLAGGADLCQPQLAHAIEKDLQGKTLHKARRATQKGRAGLIRRGPKVSVSIRP
ncbi:hypothetical protein [Roseobacter weihaiensis]|uniref:hypothetical protein n=1 Tax=Roseobacter weihaiensis TaxID=2763262 RepID=UPI001D0BCEEB|nr:hypothetical protein [Roseobacter sp. H9]